MPFLQLRLRLGDLDPEQVEQACFATGALSVTLSDAGDTPILEPAPGATPLWTSVSLSALYEAGVDRAALSAALRSALGAGTAAGSGPAAPELTFEEVADSAWEREWLKDFRPMRFGRRLWVCPGGQAPPADPGVAPVIVWLDPGLAFGTGTHATTALCLEWLDSAELAGARVLDVGCGSGVLCVAALRLGAASALALDIDPQALTATRENGARNGVADRLVVHSAAEPWGGGYDVVLANILAEPLIALAPRFAAATRVGGALVLAGLLTEQTDAVAGACAPWFDMERPRVRDGWARLVGRRHGRET